MLLITELLIKKPIYKEGSGVSGPFSYPESYSFSLAMGHHQGFEKYCVVQATWVAYAKIFFVFLMSL